MASEATPAATLILVRDRQAGPPELLMVERSADMAFAPGALVFPGGRIDAADLDLAASMHAQGSGAAIAAIRETLEESAVPLGIVPLPTREQAIAIQGALVLGADFGSILAAHGFGIEPATAIPFARWIPGHEVSRRFDTMFLLAKTEDPRREPHVGSSECVSAQWITARDALELERKGGAKLIYPTRKNLERLAQFANFDEMSADARRHPVLPITADIQTVEGDNYVCIPEGAGYPVTRDRLSTVWRG